MPSVPDNGPYPRPFGHGSYPGGEPGSRTRSTRQETGMSNIGYRDEDSPRYDIGGHIAEPGAGGTWKLTAKPEAIPEPEPQFAADLGARMMAMIAAVDTWLDEQCGPAYKEQPLAQTWARLCKDQEEKGESIAELILATGQNPRKRDQAGSRDRICEELADRSVT